MRRPSEVRWVAPGHRGGCSIRCCQKSVSVVTWRSTPSRRSSRHSRHGADGQKPNLQTDVPPAASAPPTPGTGYLVSRRPAAVTRPRTAARRLARVACLLRSPRAHPRRATEATRSPARVNEHRHRNRRPSVSLRFLESRQEGGREVSLPPAPRIAVLDGKLRLDLRTVVKVICQRGSGKDIAERSLPATSRTTSNPPRSSLPTCVDAVPTTRVRPAALRCAGRPIQLAWPDNRRPLPAVSAC